jgi:4-hydroxy-4-methyl-2-oxoglutarate aldolase
MRGSVYMLSPEQIEALGRIDSPTVSNAIEAFGVRDPTDGYASLELRCLFPDLGPMVGYAVTCTADSTTPGGPRPDGQMPLYHALAAAPKPAVVVVRDVGPSRLRSCHAGDMMMTLFHRLGAVGLVTDGGVRDVAGVRRRAPGFRVFAPGTVVSHGIPTIVEVGVTVSICGLKIRPGDLLHGDENGLLKIPLEIADQVAGQAQKVRQAEDEFALFVKSQTFSLEEMMRLFPE